MSWQVLGKELYVFYFFSLKSWINLFLWPFL